MNEYCTNCGKELVGGDVGLCDFCMQEANDRAEANRETPLGEQIDGGNDEFFGALDDMHQDEGANEDDEIVGGEDWFFDMDYEYEYPLDDSGDGEVE